MAEIHFFLNYGIARKWNKMWEDAQPNMYRQTMFAATVIRFYDRGRSAPGGGT